MTGGGDASVAKVGAARTSPVSRSVISSPYGSAVRASFAAWEVKCGMFVHPSKERSLPSRSARDLQPSFGHYGEEENDTESRLS